MGKTGKEQAIDFFFNSLHEYLQNGIINMTMVDMKDVLSKVNVLSIANGRPDEQTQEAVKTIALEMQAELGTNEAITGMIMNNIFNMVLFAVNGNGIIAEADPVLMLAPPLLMTKMVDNTIDFYEKSKGAKIILLNNPSVN